MSNMFEVLDENGRLIYLTKQQWKHILIGHPELTTELEEIQRALVKPTLIVANKTDPAKRNYYLYHKPSREYLLVAVKYLNGKAYVITAFHTRSIRRR